MINGHPEKNIFTRILVVIISVTNKKAIKKIDVMISFNTSPVPLNFKAIVEKSLYSGISVNMLDKIKKASDILSLLKKTQAINTIENVRRIDRALRSNDKFTGLNLCKLFSAIRIIPCIAPPYYKV